MEAHAVHLKDKLFHFQFPSKLWYIYICSGVDQVIENTLKLFTYNYTNKNYSVCIYISVAKTATDKQLSNIKNKHSSYT